MCKMFKVIQKTVKGGFHAPPVTFFDKIKLLCIVFDRELEFYKKFVVWDNN